MRNIKIVSPARYRRIGAAGPFLGFAMLQSQK